MKAAIACSALMFALSPVARADTVAVLQLESRVARGEVRASRLTERVREIAGRTLGDSRVLEAEECGRHCDPRAAGADVVVSGEIARGGDGYLVTLELREARSDKLIGATSATGSSEEELSDAVASAAVDLFRARNAVSAVSIAPAALPEVPQPAPLSAGINLEVDAAVLVAYDEARTVEENGTRHPDEAAAAWRAVAELGGENPYREMAAERARKWQLYAEGKRAFDSQLARDTSRLRKVLPLAFVTDATRIELLARYTRAYGSEKAAQLVAVLPFELRGRAQLAIGCEEGQSAKCVSLARAADRARDGASAIEYLDRACTANDGDACAEAGDRWLQPETRDTGRAIPALERGCKAGSGKSCARLARVHEEGDGAEVSLSRAAELREEACNKGDGKSCRKLANTIDDEKRALALWRKGCENGDAASCAIARAAGPRNEVQPATARPASSTPAQAPKPAIPTPASSNDNTAGLALMGLAAVAAGGAAIMAMPTGESNHSGRPGRNALVEAKPSSSRSGLAFAFGAAAVLSASTGLALFFSHTEPAKPSTSLTVSPSGVVLSGTLP